MPHGNEKKNNPSAWTSPCPIKIRYFRNKIEDRTDMFFNKKKDIVGVDIGSSSIKLVQLKEQEGVFHLLNIGLVPLSAEAIVDNTLDG